MVRRHTIVALALALVAALPVAAVPTRNYTGVTIKQYSQIEPGLVLLAGRDDVVRLIAPNGAVVRTWEAEEGAAFGTRSPWDGASS